MNKKEVKKTMVKKKDATKINECDESEMIKLKITEDVDEAEFELVCPKTRKDALENLPKVLKTFDILSEVDTTEDFVLGLTAKERNKLYDHKLYGMKENLQNLLP